jgi:TrmH family RNA methyltransferase
MIKPISSPHNPNFKLWRTLLDSKGVKKEKLCLVSGRKIVPEMLEQCPSLCHELLGEAEHWESLNFHLPSGLRAYELTSELFKELDEFGTRFPVLVMRLPPIEGSWREDEEPAGLEVLAALGEPQNLGALIRSCEAFGVSRVVLLKECVHPFHPKVIRSSSGSVFRVKMALGPSIEDLQGPLIVLDKGGESLAEFKWPRDLRLLMGEEGRGVPDSLARQTRVSIPMSGQVESLNAVAATSIALFQYRSKHTVAKP